MVLSNYEAYRSFDMGGFGWVVLSMPEVNDKSENMSLFNFLVCQVQAIKF